MAGWTCHDKEWQIWDGSIKVTHQIMAESLALSGDANIGGDVDVTGTGTFGGIIYGNAIGTGLDILHSATIGNHLTVGDNIIVGGTVDGIDVGTDVAANTIHRTSTGVDHTYINQNVTTTGSPAFTRVDTLGPYTAGGGNVHHKSTSNQHMYMRLESVSNTKNVGTLIYFNNSLKWYAPDYVTGIGGYLRYFNSSVNTTALTFYDAGSIVFNENGHEGLDVRMESNTEDYMFFLDAGNDRIRLGNSNGANYVEVSKTGDLVFAGSAGLVYANMYAQDNSTATTITTAGKANKVQITIFDTDGPSNNATPDHTNDHITIIKAGHYMAHVTITASGDGGDQDSFGFSLWKNNGNTEFANVHGHRNLSGGAGDIGSIHLSGIVDLVVNDTIEVWTWNEDDTHNITIDDISLSLIQIGGT